MCKIINHHLMRNNYVQINVNKCLPGQVAAKCSHSYCSKEDAKKCDQGKVQESLRRKHKKSN